MENVQLPLQKKNATLPSQLDFLSVINRRGSNYFSKEKQLYKSLHAGSLGEERALDYIKKYGPTHWKVFRNVWLNHLGKFECDIILLTHATLYIFEIKNYTGTFKYEEGKCFFENTETSINPIEQVRGNLADIKQLLQYKLPHLNIRAAVIFTGDDNDVQVKTAPNEIEIINRTQLRKFIQQIAHEEATGPVNSYNANITFKQLAKYETTNPYMPPSLTKMELQAINRGIYCPHCQSPSVEISKFRVGCNCGLIISREEAVLRAICDYGVLNYQRDLTRKEIQDFLEGEASLHLLLKTMQKHFIVVKKGRGSYFKNKKLLYEDLFRFEYSWVFHTSDSDIITFNQS